MSETRFSEFQSFVEAGVTRRGVPGVAVGLFHDGIEHTAAFGVTNVDHPLPVDADTLFQVGSITKTFTATAAMREVAAAGAELILLTPFEKQAEQMERLAAEVVPQLT